MWFLLRSYGICYVVYALSTSQFKRTTFEVLPVATRGKGLANPTAQVQS